MLEVTVKVWGIHAVSPEEEKERLQWKGYAEKEGFKSLMKERVDECSCLKFRQLFWVSATNLSVLPLRDINLAHIGARYTECFKNLQNVLMM